MPSQTTTRRRKSARQIVLPPPPPDPRLVLARRWAMWADCELQAGHHAAAEHLAHQAARLREALS